MESRVFYSNLKANWNHLTKNFWEKWRGKNLHEKRQNLDLDRKHGKRNNKQSKNFEYKTVHKSKIAVLIS